MKTRRQRIYKLGLRAFLGVLVLCGATGAAALYIGPDVIVGPSFEELHGVGCRTVVATKTRDPDGLWIRQYVVADTQDDEVRLRTALRVAESIRREQSPHLVQVSVVDAANIATLSTMRGRAIGAQVTIIPSPVTDAETLAGPISGFSVQGAASTDGEFYGIRFDSTREDLKAMAARFEEVRGCSAASPSAA
jgi:hypothetical protein